jgi:hypothetical protein
VIFVAGADFRGRNSAEMREARERHSITRQRKPNPELQPEDPAGRMVYLILGLVMGLLIGAALMRYLPW